MNERPENGKALFEGAHVAVTWSRHTHCLPWGWRCVLVYNKHFSLFVMHVWISDVTQVAIMAANIKKKKNEQMKDNIRLHIVRGEAKAWNSIDANCEVRETFCHVVTSFLFCRNQTLYKCVAWRKSILGSSFYFVLRSSCFMCRQCAIIFPTVHKI